MTGGGELQIKAPQSRKNLSSFYCRTFAGPWVCFLFFICSKINRQKGRAGAKAPRPRPMIQKFTEAKIKVFQARTLEDLKTFIEGEMADLCGVDAVLIRKKNEFVKKKGSYYFQHSLDDPACALFFKRKTPISSEEKKHLRGMSRVVSAGLIRVQKYRELQLLKKQWKSAFNAIEKPICLTDGDFNILSTNESFVKKMGRPKSDLYKKNCFLIFFGAPLNSEESRALPHTRILKKRPSENKIFEVHSQCVSKEKKNCGLRLVILADMTEKIEMEKKIAHLQESAEMGIVASSIAHELSNPLSGIGALLELIPKEENAAAAEEMLLAVRRCQKIVFQLLKSDSMPDLLRRKAPAADKSLEEASS